MPKASVSAVARDNDRAFSAGPGIFQCALGEGLDFVECQRLNVGHVSSFGSVIVASLGTGTSPGLLGSGHGCFQGEFAQLTNGFRIVWRGWRTGDAVAV